MHDTPVRVLRRHFRPHIRWATWRSITRPSSNCSRTVEHAATVRGSDGPSGATVATIARPTQRAFVAPKSAAATVAITVLAVAAGAAVCDTYRIGRFRRQGDPARRGLKHDHCLHGTPGRPRPRFVTPVDAD